MGFSRGNPGRFRLVKGALGCDAGAAQLGGARRLLHIEGGIGEERVQLADPGVA